MRQRPPLRLDRKAVDRDFCAVSLQRVDYRSESLDFCLRRHGVRAWIRSGRADIDYIGAVGLKLARLLNGRLRREMQSAIGE